MCLNNDSRTRRTALKSPSRPDLYMPAMPPLQLIAWIRRAFERRACRRQLRTLLNAEDRQLADLGLCRERIRQALRCAGDPCYRLAAAMQGETYAESPFASAARTERARMEGEDWRQ
ncbi:hypothetical protein C27AD_18393 [Salinisphaera hydrothermalis C27AD]